MIICGRPLFPKGLIKIGHVRLNAWRSMLQDTSRKWAANAKNARRAFCHNRKSQAWRLMAQCQDAANATSFDVGVVTLPEIFWSASSSK